LHLFVVSGISSCLHSEVEMNPNERAVYATPINKAKRTTILTPKYCEGNRKCIATIWCLSNKTNKLKKRETERGIWSDQIGRKRGNAVEQQVEHPEGFRRRRARGGRGSRVNCNGVCIGLGGPHIP